MTWGTVAAVAALCVTLRVASPLLLGQGGLPPLATRVLDAAVVPLVGALVAAQLFFSHGHVAVDARAAGVAGGALVFLLRRSVVLALVAAALVTALLRLA